MFAGNFLQAQTISPPPLDFACEENLFSENFESGIPSDWLVESSLYTGPLRAYADFLAGWFHHSGPTDSPGTGPDEAYEGDFYVYCEGTGPALRGEMVTLTSPAIDLSVGAVINISFFLNMHGPSASLAVHVIEGGVVTNVLPAVAGGIHSSSEWEEVYIDISDWRNKTIQIQFEAVKPGFGLNGDISIDAVQVCGSFARVPTLSEWAIIILMLTMMVVGVVFLKNVRSASFSS